MRSTIREAWKILQIIVKINLIPFQTNLFMLEEHHEKVPNRKLLHLNGIQFIPIKMMSSEIGRPFEKHSASVGTFFLIKNIMHFDWQHFESELQPVIVEKSEKFSVGWLEGYWTFYESITIFQLCKTNLKNCTTWGNTNSLSWKKFHHHSIVIAKSANAREKKNEVK